MTSPYEPLWTAVRRDFESARSLLPAEPIEQQGSVVQLDEWLDHNELELALDELEGLGDDNEPSVEYWRHLLNAAERMQLTQHHARIVERVQSIGGR